VFYREFEELWSVRMERALVNQPQGVEHFAKDSPFRDSSQICGQTDGK